MDSKFEKIKKKPCRVVCGELVNKIKKRQHESCEKVVLPSVQREMSCFCSAEIFRKFRIQILSRQHDFIEIIHLCFYQKREQDACSYLSALWLQTSSW